MHALAASCEELRARTGKPPLYKGGGAHIRGGANTWTIFCVSNKQVRHKQVSTKQENKHVKPSLIHIVVKTMTMFLNIVLCYIKRQCQC